MLISNKQICKLYCKMNYQIKRVTSSNPKSKQKPKPKPNRLWSRNAKIPTSQMATSQSSNLYPTDRMIYSSVEFKNKPRAKSHIMSIVKTNDSLATLRITSRSWCVFDQVKNKFVGFREKNQREIASLTKIMTTVLSLEFLHTCDLNPDLYVKVTETSAKMIGTTASLKARTWIRYTDLLYGAMLPSGNDAAYLLSEVVGYLSKQSRNVQYIRNLKFLDISNDNTNLYTVEFIKLMNRKAEDLSMRSTQFSNPHGLQNAMNISSPKDMVILSCYAAKNPKFRRIMNTQTHHYDYVEVVESVGLTDSQKTTARSRDNRTEKVNIHRSQWENTNVLLKKGWEGVKTGQTGPAGSCLASLRNNIFIVVLNCTDNQSRFTDTERIYQWYMLNRNIE